MLTIVEHDVGWDADSNLSAGAPQRVAARELSATQVAGLDAFLRLLRITQPGPHAYYDTYDIRYLRDGQAIGRERHVDFQYLDSYFGSSYDRLPLALQSEITPENWAQIVTFRTLRRELGLDGAKIQ